MATNQTSDGDNIQCFSTSLSRRRKLYVQSHIVGSRTNSKQFWFRFPLFNDKFPRRQAMQRFQSLCKIIRVDKCLKMLLQRGLRLIIIPMHSRLLNRFIHSLNLAICPRMRWKSEPVLDFVFFANSIENMRQSPVVPSLIRELHAIVRQIGYFFNFFFGFFSSFSGSLLIPWR